MCIIITIAAGAVVALLAMYVFGGQQLRDSSLNKEITNKHNQLKEVSDLTNALTIQHQLDTVSGQHDSKKIQSRMFDVLSAIVEGSDSGVAVAKMSVDPEGIVSIEGEATGGYKALEQFKKSINATTFSYMSEDSSRATVQLASNLADGERSYGENADGRKVLRFALSFTCDPAIFDRDSKSGVVIAPKRKNATDSKIAVPKSLFSASTVEKSEETE